MGKHALLLAFAALALACNGEDDLTTGEQPATPGCECPLDAKLDNLALCISPTTAFEAAHVYSSSLEGGDEGASCEPARVPQPKPVAPWSRLTVSSPCAGTGEFCITIWSGNARQPGFGDCRLARVCSAVDYAGNRAQVELAPLPSWVAESSDCAQRYEREGGYLQFEVVSEQLGCNMEMGSTKLVPLCPVRCEADPAGEGCAACGNGPIVRL